MTTDVRALLATTPDRASTPSLYERAEMVTVRVRDRALRICALRLPATRSGAARKFLLLHGNPSHIDHFAANVEHLREHGDVALFDAPGFGRSAPTDAPLGLDFLAEVAVAYADSLGWAEGIDVIGQSHGGAIGQTIAAHDPERVNTLVLLGSMGYPAHLSMRLAMLPGAEAATYYAARWAPLRPIARAIAARLTAVSFSPDPVPEGLVDRELAHVLAVPEVQRSMMRVNAGDPTHQLRRQGHQIRCPVLVVHGRGDRLVPIDHVQRLFAIIGAGSPRSRFEAVEGGHMVHLSRPEIVHGVLDRWLAETSLAGPPRRIAPSGNSS